MSAAIKYGRGATQSEADVAKHIGDQLRAFHEYVARREQGDCRGPLATIGRESHANAQAKGFYLDLEATLGHLRMDRRYKLAAFVENLWRLARIALIHSELSEAVEAIRDGNTKGAVVNGKPEGLPSELADAVIRIADLAHAQMIDLDRAVAEKTAYNATRPRGHGRRSRL